MNSIVLDLPEEIYSQFRLIAEAAALPIEQVMVSRLRSTLELPDGQHDEDDELHALQQLSDDALWTIAREQMPDDAQARAHVLMDKNSLGQIAPAEYAELEKLVERGDRLMVRKAEAAALLIQRGYTFAQKDFRPHE